MSAQHAPDLQPELQDNYPEPSKEAYKWPDINLEDLTTPKLFLILLNARGRNPPSLFVGSDNDSYEVGYLNGKISLISLEKHTMMSTGRDNAKEYGNIFEWKNHREAHHWFISGRGLSPGEGSA
ncbi:hypothetical protein PENVUL_c030G00752 [Penicillium vulpinum]|uniref:Uncharacterized protein n=2 Tax=Penicillium vulpinum TaxID=29845 RepID=A0A1V6RT25_9EURO|nr:hypothetical protein PENVUL_c030G00752 [Penicillium vulpinum]